MNAPVTTIGMLLRAVAGVTTIPGIGADRLAPVLNTLAALAEVPNYTEADRQKLLAMVDTWVRDQRGPTEDELDALKATRDSLDQQAQAALASLPPKGSKAGAFLAAVLGVGFLLSLVGVMPVAEAQTPQTGTLVVTWVNPTTYTDGSALPSSEIVANRVAWGTCAGSAFTKAGEHKLARTTTDTVTGLTLGGTYCVQVFATAQKSGGQAVESAGTSFANITFPPPVVTTPTPGSPTTVTVTCTVNGQVITCTGTLK